ncbi:unnamed protein product [Caenorhabditis brenneri]
MTEFLKNNPIALRHCILYEFLRKNPLEESFNAFCKTVGDDAYKKEEFKFWFNQFEQGRFDAKNDDGPITDMKDVLRNDKYALRTCILYESLKYRQSERNNESLQHPSFSAYQNFCNVIGEDVMEYREFDFWFYRFLNGLMDLNYEKEEHNKVYELMDMPIHIMEHLVKYLDIHDRQELAKTNRSLRTFTEDQKLNIQHLTLNINRDNVLINVECEDDIEYKWTADGCIKVFKKSEQLFRGVPHWKQAFLDLKSFLKYPKLHLNTLEIDCFIEHYFYDHLDPSLIPFLPDEISDELKSAFQFTHHVNVKNLILFANPKNPILSVLPFLKPGYLTTINSEIHDSMIDQLVVLEQWKQAKCFDTYYCIFLSPLRHLYHFEKFFVNIWTQSLEDVGEMKEILFKSPDFKMCSLKLDYPIEMDIIGREFGDAIHENPNVYRYPIPDSNEMTEYFKNNPIALRHCILYEFLRKNPVEESFNAFCKTVGDDAIKKEEFQFWFNRFEKGIFDLNLERKEDKKEYELKDMPLDVMEKVVKCLNISDRLALSKTCRSLHLFIPDQKVFVRTLDLSFHINTAYITFGPWYLKYVRSGNNCLKLFGTHKTFVQNVSYWKQALLDFKNCIKYPKLHVDIFKLNYVNMHTEAFGTEIVDELDTVLKSANQLNVKKFCFRASSVEPLLKTLPYLKPGYLTTLHIFINLPSEYGMDEVVKMEQWKQAKCLVMRRLCFSGPLRDFFHFNVFNVCRIGISVEDVRQMKEVLFKSTNFKKCSIKFKNPIDTSAIKREFGDAFSGNICHYPIANTNEHFKIKVVELKVEISRK